MYGFKRTTALLAAICLIFTLTGCKKTAIDNSQASSVSSDASKSLPSSSSVSPSVSASPKAVPSSTASDGSITGKDYKNSKGEKIMSFEITVDKVKKADNAQSNAADTINQQITDMAKIDQSTADQLAKQAEADKTSNAAMMPYFDSKEYTVVFNNSKFVSFTVASSVFSGGAHSLDTVTAVNFNGETGTKMTLDDVFSVDSNVYLSKIYSEVEKQIEVEKASKSEEDFLYYSNYSEALRNTQFEDKWYFTDKGLCVIYNPYEIASYVAGVKQFVIPYESLKNIMKITVV